MLPILYSFRRCPYAMRARLALAYAQVSVILREVVLRDKPSAMRAISPKATVPVLQLACGQVIDESFEIMLWALDQAPNQAWLSADNREAVLMWVSRCDNDFKPALDAYKYAERDGQDPIPFRIEAEVFIAYLEHKLKSQPFLLGDAITLADMAVLPFVRQFAHVDLTWFEQCDYPAVRAWLNDFKQSVLFKSVMAQYAQWHEGDADHLFPEPNRSAS